METISDKTIEVALVGMGGMGTAMAQQLEQNNEYVVTPIRRGDDHAVLEHQAMAVVCVTPQQWGAVDERTGRRVSEQIGEHVNSRGVLVWIMAGITTRKMRESLGNNSVALVRTMLTRAVDGYSLAALYAEEGALTAEQKSDTEELFAQFGEYLWLDDEDQFADFTVLVGSGVGLFAEFTETFRRIAVEKRFSSEQADKMSRAALRGADHLITAEHSAIDTIADITTEKGVTAVALRALRYGGFQRLMRRVVKAGARRSHELAKS